MFKYIKFDAKFEFIILIGLVFGWAIFGAVLSLKHNLLDMGPARIVLTDPEMVGTACIEINVSALAIALLYQRKWTLADFPIEVNLRASTLGIALFILAEWVMIFAQQFSLAALGQSAAGPTLVSQVTPAFGVPFALLNGAFEEIFVLGYVYRFFEKHLTSSTSGVAIPVSALIRASYHIYQGPANAIAIFVFGLLTGIIFSRYRNLWPIISAHILADILIVL